MNLHMSRELQFSRLKASDFKGNAHMQEVRTIQPSILDLIQLAVCRYGGMQVKLRDSARPGFQQGQLSIQTH